MTLDYSHRKSTLKIRLCNRDGKPAANTPVRINLLSHEFLFGCGGFDAVELAGGKRDGSPLDAAEAKATQERLEKIFGLHNYATLPFYLARYEEEEGKPDEKRTRAAAEWYTQRQVKLKGHPLCWHSVCAPWLMNYSNKEVLDKVVRRIERDVSAFKGLINMWDVINEVVIMPVFNKYDNAITRLCKELGRVGMVKEVFAAAHSANPEAVLLLNDFDLSSDYEKLIDECLQAGVPINALGLQTHQHQGYMGKEKLLNVLERYSRFGLPLHFTENTLISGDLMPPHIVDLNDWQVDEWPTNPEGEERQAREMEEFFSIIFAHPKVEAITTWCAIDGRWLKAPAGLLRLDNSEKPSFHALSDKITKEWHTELETASNREGLLSFEGFRGDYELTAMGKKINFTLDGKNDALALQLH